MAERQPPSWDDIRGIIDRVDELCRESERTRHRAERAMKKKPFWPERRRTERTGAEGDESPDV